MYDSQMNENYVLMHRSMLNSRVRLMTHTARRVFAAFSPRYREDYPATHSAFSPRIRCQICAGELDCSDVAGSA